MLLIMTVFSSSTTAAGETGSVQLVFGGEGGQVQELTPPGRTPAPLPGE